MKIKLFQISLFVAAIFFVQTAFSQSNPLENSVQNGCAKYKKEYDAIKAFLTANKGKKPPTPTPPIVDPDCQDCNDKTHDNQMQQAIDAFNNKSVQPEQGMITTLLTIAQQKKLLLGDAAGLESEKANGTFDCLNYFDDDDMTKMANALAQRLYTKISTMLDKYHTNGKYFLGGIRYYFGAARYLVFLGAMNPSNNPYRAIDFESPETQAWIEAYYKKYKDRLFNQHQYQLYPTIFYLPREMALLGGINLDNSSHLVVDKNGQFSIEQSHELQDLWNKAISMMHFKLKIVFDGTGKQTNLHFEGETEIKCVTKNGCFSWVPENGNTMTFKIQPFVIHGDFKEVITYKGPMEFKVPVTFNVNLCDKNDRVFRMYFDRLWPEEEQYSHNQAGELNTPFIADVVTATLAAGNTENMKKQISKYKEAQSKYSDAEMEAWNNRMEAHKNDRNYFKTTQGKKDLTIAQQLKHQFGSVSSGDQEQLNNLSELEKERQKHFAADPNYVGSAQYYEDKAQIEAATNTSQQIMQKATGGAMTVKKLELPFKVGSTEPVNGTVGNEDNDASSGGQGFKGSFKITLVNTPDDKDNIKL